MMQSRPSKAELLDAVARFFVSELMPCIPDRALGFRVRIAVHLLQGLARQVRAEEAGATSDLDVADILAHIHDPSTSSDILETIRAELLEALAADLSVTNPRFETLGGE